MRIMGCDELVSSQADFECLSLWDSESGMPGRRQDARRKKRSSTASQRSTSQPPTNLTYGTRTLINPVPTNLEASSSTLDSSSANNHIGSLSPLPEESSCYSTRYVAQHTYVMRPTATNMAFEARRRVDMPILLSPTWSYT